MSNNNTDTPPKPAISPEMQRIMDRSGMELVLSRPTALGMNVSEREWLIVPVDRHEKHKERVLLSALNQGKISQEEFDRLYPDGCPAV